MARISTRRIRRWVTVLLLAIFVISLADWVLRGDRIPRTVRIATGERGGLYFQVGEAIAESLGQRTGRQVEAEPSHGSEDNCEQIQSGDAELAIVQGGSVAIDQLTVVTPLFPELVFIIARNGSDIKSIHDLAGEAVALGPQGSGNRISALELLAHYGINATQLENNLAYFKTLLDEDTPLNAAIVTAGVAHPDLRQVLATNKFHLVPIHSADAIDMTHPFMRQAIVPQGLFAEHPAVPSEPIPTIATTAYLVSSPMASDSLVEAALASIHEESLRLHVPTLIPRNEASGRTITRLHPVAQRYFNPSDQLGLMANVMESLAATKELLFAFGAGVYLIWMRWRRLNEREALELLSRQKEHLDRFLERTLEIEKAQLETDDQAELAQYLMQVTQIKLKALYEFTEEELRGDQAFSIFLEQCASLMNKIQLKIISQGPPP